MGVHSVIGNMIAVLSGRESTESTENYPHKNDAQVPELTKRRASWRMHARLFSNRRSCVGHSTAANEQPGCCCYVVSEVIDRLDDVPL